MHYLDALTPYTRNTTLVNFMPVPKYIFAMGLSSTAILLYIHLLDRASISQKNGWHNQDGWVYLIFTVGDLAQALHKTRSTIQKLLSELEGKGLIIRDRPIPGGANHYFLRVPTSSAAAQEEASFSTSVKKIPPAESFTQGCMHFLWGRHQKSDPNKQRE